MSHVLYDILVQWKNLHTSFVFLLRKLSSTVTIFPNKGTSLDIHILCFTFIFQKYLIALHRIWDIILIGVLTSSGYLIEKSSKEYCMVIQCLTVCMMVRLLLLSILECMAKLRKALRVA